MKTQNYNEFIYFIYTGTNPQYSFRAYVDQETGMESGYIIGYDKNKQPIYKWWEFDFLTMRQIRVHKDQADKEKKNAAEFLRKSPECFKSVNGKYIGDGAQVAYLFKELNESKDATDAIASRSIKIEAEKKALDLKSEELMEISQVLGIFKADEALVHHSVLDYAGNHPAKFMALLTDPARKVKAIIEKALVDHVFSQSGKLILWEGKQIGADKDDAVATLMKDEKLLAAIKLNLQKFGS